MNIEKPDFARLDSPDGLMTTGPADGWVTALDHRGLLAYCEKMGKQPKELTPEELKPFDRGKFFVGKTQEEKAEPKAV